MPENSYTLIFKTCAHVEESMWEFASAGGLKRTARVEGRRIGGEHCVEAHIQLSGTGGEYSLVCVELSGTGGLKGIQLEESAYGLKYLVKSLGLKGPRGIQRLQLG